MDGPAIEIHDLHHRHTATPVLRGIDLTIERGEVFGFLGHNGAGKTTAINILTTLIRPTSGTARVCGHDVVGDRAAVTREIGYLPSEVRLYGHLTAAENLEFFGALSGLTDPRRAVAETLDFLGCAELAEERVGSFSTGMRQRIGIAQAVLHRPAVLFLDEPTAGLDPTGVRQLRETIARLNTELGMTMFMNTHLLSEVTACCGSTCRRTSTYAPTTRRRWTRSPPGSTGDPAACWGGGPRPRCSGRCPSVARGSRGAG